MAVKDVLAKKGPRKLLALDGGGIRGMMSIEVLAEIEQYLQKALGQDDRFVLADYFDYIGGTSTGAIIAACLAVGKRVDEVRQFYIESGPDMFQPANLKQRLLLRSRFAREPLEDRLQSVLGEDTLLHSDKIRTLLLLILRNATTDSPWPISNNPAAMYSLRSRPDCNLDLPLWQLVRASTAAPTFFPPEVIPIGDNPFVFVDGGVTMYNNPALQLFLMATAGPYNLRWPVGEDKLLLVSVGTGTAAKANVELHPEEMNLLYNATSIPAALMAAASHQQDLLCRVLGKCMSGDPIDREVGHLIRNAEDTGETRLRYSS